MVARTGAAFILVAASLAGGGCGASSTVWVAGKVVKGGAGYSPPDGRKIAVTLHALEVKGADGKPLGAEEPFQAQVNQSDGTFIVPGPDGRGILPGRYRISVVENPTRDALTQLARDPKTKRPSRTPPPIDRDTDFFRGQFGPGSSPVIREIKGSGDLVIDLDRPTAAPPG
jgi:hypothetical protein